MNAWTFSNLAGILVVKLIRWWSNDYKFLKYKKKLKYNDKIQKI